MTPNHGPTPDTTANGTARTETALIPERNGQGAPPERMSEEEYARKNQRRAELIWKKNRQGLTPEELTEFTHLQELICEYLDARFPGPSEFLEQVEERARRLGDLP